METDGPRTLFSGQAAFEDRAVGLAVELELGEAMGVTVLPRLVSDRSKGLISEQVFEIAVHNDKTEAVVVEIVPDRWDRRGFAIIDPNRQSAISEAGYPAWTLRLRPGQSETLTYTVRTDD